MTRTARIVFRVCSVRVPLSLTEPGSVPAFSGWASRSHSTICRRVQRSLDFWLDIPAVAG